MFMISMLGLVLADNLLILFLFWELTTFSSFLLIGFDHQKKEARQSAWQAIIVTTMGALSMLAGFILVGEIVGSYQLSDIIKHKDLVQNHDHYTPILVLILLGAFTKSAQFPFHFWLPAAMTAPTPVSAYLHSVTMVKAGIYLLSRFLFILGHTKEWFFILTIVGSLTMLTGSVLAIRQDDMKLILAYLTISALGTLTLLLGVGSLEAMKAMVIFLLVHSFYKGSLFLVVGNIDHETKTRKVSELKGLSKTMPYTSCAALLALITMAGIPPSLGFLGKEMIYKSSLYLPVILTIAVASMVASTYVAINLIVNVFLSKGAPVIKRNDNPLLWIPPLILATLIFCVGLNWSWLEISFFKSILSSVIGSSVERVAPEGIKFDKVLGLSALTLFLGILLHWKGKKLLNFVRVLEESSKNISPSLLYLRLQTGVMKLGSRIERVSNRGYYHKYMTVILWACSLFLMLGLWRNASLIRIPEFKGMETYEWGLVTVIIISVVGAILIKNLIASVMLLGVVGFTIAIIFVSYGAPDLALTQLLIETLTIILFALIAIKFPNRSKHYFSSLKTKKDIFLAGTFGSLMTILLLSITSYPFNDYLSKFYADKSYVEGKGRNVVNVILVDFRSLDTLGEITVLSIAGLGFFSLLKLSLRRRKT
ncbi:MAG TPA: hydrogen gas-evolving membrane-bound hydrogenase subunit E [Bacteriovoracaceae bacterium]|nr:hydrogen gas-evolving membrane-bound hydrogenase subunit E [Bacteriovoracaceae bacterium]